MGISEVSGKKDKIRELTKRNNGWGNEYRSMKLTQFVRGWVNYFPPADMKGLTRKTGEWLRHKIKNHLLETMERSQEEIQRMKEVRNRN